MARSDLMSVKLDFQALTGEFPVTFVTDILCIFLPITYKGKNHAEPSGQYKTLESGKVQSICPSTEHHRRGETCIFPLVYKKETMTHMFGS